MEKVPCSENCRSNGNAFREMWDLLYAFSYITRRCIVPIVFVAILLLCLYIPQSTEFFASLLLVCASEPGRCGQDIGINSSSLQFLVFEMLLFSFAICVWYAARVLASYPEIIGSRDNRYTNRMTVWLPRVIGAVPIYLLSFTLLTPLKSSMPAMQIIAGLFYVTLLLLGPFLLYEYVPQKFGLRKLIYGVVIGIISVVFCTLQPMKEPSIWSFMGSWILILIFYITFAWQFAEKKLYRLLGIAFMQLLTGSAIIGIGIAANAVTSMHTWNWTVSVTLLTPAVYLVFVIYRKRFGLDQSGIKFFTAIDKELNISSVARLMAPRLPWESFLIGTIALLSVLVLSAILIAAPDRSAQLLFAPATVVLWLILIMLLVLTFLFFIPLVIRFMLTAFLLTMILLPNVPEMALGQKEVVLNTDLCNDRAGICDSDDAVTKQYAAWQSLHGGDTDTKPIIVVAAAGGGARAAAHTAAMLAAVDAATCGEFGDRVFAISAVSGGALGAAAYVASRSDLPMLKADRENCWQARDQVTRPDPLTQQLIRMTSKDHLSPTLIRGLFRDLPLSMLPASVRADLLNSRNASDYLSRAGTLYDSWANSYTELLKNNGQRKTSNPNAFTNGSNSTNGAADGSGPYLLLNATSVQDGRRIVMSKPLFCPKDGYCAAYSWSLLSSAIDSARFPFISPPHNREVYGWSDWHKSRFATKRSFVDGGYVDNSGILTLVDVVNGLIASKVDPKRIKVILITNDPQEGVSIQNVPDYGDTGLFAQLAGPLKAVISSRAGHSESALISLKRLLKDEQFVYWPLTNRNLNPVDEKYKATLARPPEWVALELLNGIDRKAMESQYEAPLAWALSQEAAQSIARYAFARHHGYSHSEDFIYENERALIEQLNAGHYDPHH